MFDLLQQFLISIAVSYLSLTNSLAGKIEEIFADSARDDEFIALHAEPLDDTQKDAPLPMRGISNILRHDQNFQRAALIAANEPTQDYASPDILETEELLKESLVNVYCQYKTESYTRTTTGTGFFINQKGVILTNAHVAQFLLLEEEGSEEGDVDCVIRTGNPATAQYKAELLYISPTWIFNNASLITEERPRGTGERDYALLYVSESVENVTLPERFPALPVQVTLLPRSTEGKKVLLGGYPAGALLRGGADAELESVIAESSIGSLYTFGSNYADLFAVAGSLVGEEGASGGPIIDSETGKTIGLIVTRGDVSEGARSLRALTLSYLDRTMEEETGFSLAQNMQGDIAVRGKIFKDAIVPFLAGILEKELGDGENER